jgi:hypothetical protein
MNITFNFTAKIEEKRVFCKRGVKMGRFGCARCRAGSASAAGFAV